MKTTFKLYILLTFCLQYNALSASIDTIPLTQNIGHVSTTWDDFTTVSPSEGIPLIQVPVANFNGTAQLTFPIKLPEARKGFAPQLSIDYNNEGGGSWLGQGWDLGVSSFSLDTRWGVPMFSSSFESEIYLFEGEQLGPVFHREKVYSREADRSFHLRQETEFHKITRHGNSTKNYWWEVAHKDGAKYYYGGTPKDGFLGSHALVNSAGHITSWQLVECSDIYGNYQRYTYSKVNKNLGSNIYLSSITYNGFEGEEGNYKVQFNLLENGFRRKDISLSARTGMMVSTADLLGEIVISYKDQVIRSYKPNYTTGAFDKTLLASISEFDQLGALFYTYEFDYFDDVRQGGVYNAFSASKSWNVPKDNVASGTLVSNINAFKSKPTLLGGAKSTSIGGGLAVTVGPPFNPVTKANSAGPNSSVSNTNSEGLIAFVDINGDGLPDKVWKEEDGLYFRPNLHSVENPVEGFGIRRKIEGIKDFSLGSTFAWTVGAEVNFVGASAEYQHEESTTTVGTYFADFNGDELMDIAHKGQVYFNHISPTGIPTFTLLSGDTPSIIYKGDDIVNDPLTLEEIEVLQKQNPLHDAVRVWTAPYSGRVKIEGAFQLVKDNSQEASNYQLKDGVIVFVQLEGINIYNNIIAADDFQPKSLNGLDDVQVGRGDKIYFRVNSRDDGLYDQVLCTPKISYLNEDLTIKDVNGLAKYAYDSQKDFILSGSGEVILPSDGVVSLKGNLKKPILTDTLFLEISGIIDTTIKLAPSLVFNGDLLIENIIVKNGEKAFFKVKSRSNILWQDISWSPLLEYTAFDDGSDVTDPDGNPILTICPSVQLDLYNKVLDFGEVYVAPDSGVLQLDMELMNLVIWGSNNPDFDVTLKIKGKPDSIVVARDSIVENLGNSQLELYSKGAIRVEQGDSVYINLNYGIESAFDLLVPSQTRLTLNGQQTNIDAGVAYSFIDENDTEGLGYRQWGQFVYNPEGDLPLFPMNLAALDVDTTGLAGDTALVDTTTNHMDLEGANASVENKFIVMTSDPKTKAWRGSDEVTFFDGAILSATRYGRKNITDVGGSPGATVSAPDIISKTRGDGGAGGIGLGPASVSAGYTGVTTWSIKDIGDMNGDRYPDIINLNSIRYTGIRGGLTSLSVTHNFETHEVFSEAFVAGVGGSSPPSSSANNAGSSAGKGSNKSSRRAKSKSKSSMSKSRSANDSASGSVGISGSFAKDDDAAVHTFIDINGDGLEDKIWDDGQVALSIGYGFLPKSQWNFSGINNGNSFDTGGGIGIDIHNGSIQAGVSISSTDNQSKLGFVDVNDDALIDQVVSVNPLMVRINRGIEFGPPILWLAEEYIDEGRSIGESANGAVTICLEFLFFRVCFNPSTFVGFGTSAINTTFQDVNGDGFADFLRAEGSDDHLQVKTSKIGRTNFLREIKYPTIGHMKLDYAFIGNTYDIPFSKWALIASESYDGLDGDGISTYKKEYSYADGKYDRHERQFYGFNEVEEVHLDDAQIGRRIVTKYEGDSYYRKGLNSSQEIFNSEGELIKSISQVYELRDIGSGASLPLSFERRDDIAAFPALVSRKTTLYEGSSDGLSLIESYTYDTIGNIITLVEEDQGGYTKTDEYEYDYDFDQYFLTKLIRHSITSNGELHRETQYDRDVKGNTLVTKRLIEEGRYVSTEMKYDAYSNVKELIKPPNYKDQRMTFEYKYDDSEHQYLIEEKDSYGYIKTYEHDYFYNELLAFTDINANRTEHTYDTKGRLLTIKLAREIEDDIPYSIAFEYNPQADVPYSRNKHYDPSWGGDLEYVEFEDGLQRSVQTKKQTMLHSSGLTTQEGYIVSGTDIYDGLGRIIESYLPITEGVSSPTIFNPASDLDTLPTRMTFDVLGRVLTQEDTYGNITISNYSVDLDNRGAKRLAILKTNPKKNTSTQFYSMRGDLMAERYDGVDGDIWSTYTFDAMSQVTLITDHLDNETTYDYDLLGRRTAVKVPDAGLTTLAYDDANNLTDRTTATIRDVIKEDGSIRYSYDYERLTTIDYPKYFQNKVQLHYGGPQDSFNRVGRVWLQEDATGGREYFFDINGNPTKTIRTIMVNRTNVFTMVREAEYDTWGRALSMTYPDGEKLTYGYDKGGKLITMTGQKGDDYYEYLKFAGYDKFEDRVHLIYGNDVNGSYEYDDKGRLRKRIVDAPQNALLDEEYFYDPMDNVSSLENKAQGTEDMGGISSENYSYDILERLSTAEGQWQGKDEHSYNLLFDYNDVNDLTFKSQNLTMNAANNVDASRTFDYQYENDETPLRPSEIGGKQYHYDANGNILLSNSQAIFNYDQHIYDEENRLIGTSNNGYISLYTYDAYGRRTIKSHGVSQGLFINGAPAGFVEHESNVQVEFSPYLTKYENSFRKHYFIDDIRILTKIGTGVFETTLGVGPELTAGSIDYKTRIQAYESSILDYYGSLGVAPGPPTMLALLGQPEINQTGLPNTDGSNPFNVPPSNWPNVPPPDTTGPPGPPVFYEQSDINNDNVEAGYNFSGGGITEELIQFFYHYDHTGSTRFVTDYNGDPRQYAYFLPSGERWIYQTKNDDESNYMYNAMTLDNETGFYNLGDVYIDPVTSIDLSLDPVLQNYGQQTFKRRLEGDFYYEYADAETETSFDNEILNSEKPQPFLANAVNPVDNPDDEEDEEYFTIRIIKRAKSKQKVGNTKQAVVAELKEIQSAFAKQDKDSPTEFYYPDFKSFFKAKNAEKKHKKRMAIKAAARKKKQRKRRRVRFK